MLLVRKTSPVGANASSAIPLVFDLDGTLIHTDTFHEMMAQLLRKKPWVLLKLPFCFLKGRPFAKAQLLEATDIDPACLPYNVRVLQFAKKEASQGRPLVLATGTPHKLAQKIAAHLGIFQEVIGSNDQVNMTGLHKQRALLECFGDKGFDYVGDSRIDAHIWKVSRNALVAHPKWGVFRRAKAMNGSEDTVCFPRTMSRLWACVLALRPLCWIWGALTLSWTLGISFSLLTSGLLILGDLLSLETERTKGVTPPSVFAAGHLHLTTAFLLSALLIIPPLFLFSGLFLYAPVLMAADWGTRSSPPILRWLLLSLLQMLSTVLLTL